MACEDYALVTKVYKGHDNPVIVVPYSDISERVFYDMTDVTSVDVSADLTSSVVTGDDISASSTDDPVTIWWANTSGSEWRIYIKVGMFVGIAAGSYKLRVVIFEPDFPNGIVIADDLLVDVVDIP